MTTVVKMKLFPLNRKATQVLWMGLLSLAVLAIIREPFLLLTTPTNEIEGSRLPSETALENLSFIAANQQIGSLKELIMMNNIPTNKWIVVDGLRTNKCTDVTAFTQHVDWRVVVVISKWDGYITGCRFPRCVIISDKNLLMMMGELALTEIMKRTTKLSGYLFAIRQGADTILDATCTNASQFSPDYLSMNDKLPLNELLHNDSTIFNPYEHFGHESTYSSPTFSVLQESLSGSSNPLYDVTLRESDMYYLQPLNVQYIKQGVSKCHANYENNKRNIDTPGIFSNLPVSLGTKTIGVLDSGPTIFYKNAFLSLFVPTDLTQNQQNIFRSLFIYGIRSFTPIPISYYPVQDIAGCLSCQSVSGESLTLDEFQLRDYLKWIQNSGCNRYTEVVHCTIDVLNRVLNIIRGTSHSVAKWKRSWRSLLLAWLDDLAFSGLDDVYFEKKDSHYSDTAFQDSNRIKIHFAFHKNSWNTVSSQQKSQLQSNVFDYYRTVCSNVSQSPAPVSFENWRKPVMEDIMLIVIINYESLITAAPYIEFLHRYFFRYITYCGPGVEGFQKYAKDNGFTHITYINGLAHGWEHMYDCTMHAMNLGMPVRGYLQIGDDTLIDARKLSSLPRDMIWLPGGYDKKNFYEVKSLDYWGHWQRDHGRPAVLNIFNELYNVSTSDTPTILFENRNVTVSQEYRSFTRRFIQTYDKNIGVSNAVHRAIDIFYVPEIVKSDFILAASLFMRHGSIVEMAVPMINFGLLPLNKIKFLRGASLWRKDREKPWTMFDVKTMHFLHPLKSLSHLKQREGQQFFCKDFLPNIFNYTFVARKK